MGGRERAKSRKTRVVLPVRLTVADKREPPFLGSTDPDMGELRRILSDIQWMKAGLTHAYNPALRGFLFRLDTQL